MIFLIGGAPRTGKSLLAQRLAGELGIGWFSLDVLRYVVRDQLSGVELGGFDRPQGPWADQFFPYVKDIVVASGWVADSYVIEGADFMPRHVATIPDETDLRACFLGLLAPNLEQIDAHAGRNDYQRYLDSETRDRMLAWIATYSAELRDECEAYDVPYVDLSDDYPAGIERVLDVFHVSCHTREG